MGSDFHDGSRPNGPPGVWTPGGTYRTEEEDAFQYSTMPPATSIDPALLQIDSPYDPLVTQNPGTGLTAPADTHYLGETSSVVYPPYGTGLAGGMAH
ncbi:hypothetical protein LIA77_11982 [Sarocladium implicatum]|nr:hypothetical protein LIA77_11982 [Sarocladium implicatum]